jgi:ribose transport system permease protein
MRSLKVSPAVLEYAGLVIALALLVGLFASKAPHFLSIQTVRTIAASVPDAVFLAVGMTFVLIIAGIDLSVGSVVGLSGAVLGVCLGVWKLPLVPSIMVSLATGAACGFLNGLIAERWRLPSFIVTLGTLEMARGGAYLVSGSQTQYVGGPIERIADASVFGISVPFICCILAVAVAQFVLLRTVFGRYAIAIGTNEEAVRLSGINPLPTKIAVFTICGLLASVAAVMNVSRLASADPNAGTGFELQAIAAVVIGGTSLMGGRGTVIGSFFGVIIIAVLENGLAQIGAQEPVKRLATGAVIILAVVIDRYRQRLSTA